ncbi:MAG: thermonuclease family protein [Helicobacteraceae bacterium]|nr:thermonuclease family protein [Helicobacteraceae bacterium]
MLAFAVSLAAAFLLAACVPKQDDLIYGVASRVIDGDTIDFKTDSGETIRTRLNCIDAPEKKQPYGESARRVLSATIAGEYIRVVTIETDRYGRTVGVVYLDNFNINLAYESRI